MYVVLLKIGDEEYCFDDYDGAEKYIRDNYCSDYKGELDIDTNKYFGNEYDSCRVYHQDAFFSGSGSCSIVTKRLLVLN